MSNIPKIIDNKRKMLLDVIHRTAQEYEQLSIATGYWDLPGTELILEDISHYKKIRLLIGREPLIPRHSQYEPEVDYPDRDMYEDLQLLQPTESLKNTVKQLKALIDQGVLEVRVYRKSFFHAKCYIFGGYGSEQGVGIIGSSNFTKNGLTYNAELNALESDHRIVFFQPQNDQQEYGHLAWFDHFWNDESTELWDGKFCEILSESPVGDELFSPYQTYIKTLYELYKEELEDVEIKNDSQGICSLYEFQQRNVQAVLRRLKKHGVAMLADSVGLGKTFTSLEVIRQYKNGDRGKQRVEIICPKSLVSQWRKESLKQNVEVHPITLQNREQIEAQRALDDVANVALFVIDESHNLKSRTSKRFEQIVDWIRNNPKAHVLLLTATPINNQLSDITNQILLGTRGQADIFNVTTSRNNQVETINFNQAIENLKKKIGQDVKRDGTIDYEYIRQVMAPILRAFVVRQTRQGIQREYGGLKDQNGDMKVFPTVVPEIKKYNFSREVSEEIQQLQSDVVDMPKIYSLDSGVIINNTKSLLHPIDQIAKLTAETSFEQGQSPIFFVYQTILLLGFLPYRWMIYQTKYYGKTRQEIKALNLAESSAESKMLFSQLSIYGILRTMFLKRMESSVSAFRKSLEIYERKIVAFERGIELGQIISVKDINDIEQQLELQSEEFDLDDIDLDDEYVADRIEGHNYNVDAIKNDIKKEKALIGILKKQMLILERDDSKLQSFAQLLDELLQRNINGGKVLVFSFYADTVKYLQENLFTHSQQLNSVNTAFLTSQNRSDADSLSGRFSPQSKDYVLRDGEQELQCLVATDVLSEGQNLQDCGVLVNYDLHWNPVRMIQRNGRVNRLGTEHEHVYIYNLTPEQKIEEHLKLIDSLEKKINLIRNTIGTDTPVLDEEENPIEFCDSWADIYSEDMQKRMEALERAEDEADLLLAEDVYVSDLKKFDTENDEEIKKKVYGIPRGKWALMPQGNHRNIADRPEVLAMNTLRGVTETGSFYDMGHTFLVMSRNPQDPVRYVSVVETLEWLKSERDFTKIPDHISCNKDEIAKTANEKAEMTEVHQGGEVGQERDLLHILMQNHLPQEDIIEIRTALHTRNILDQQKITQLKRRIVRNNRSGILNADEIAELLHIARKTNAEVVIEQSEVDHNIQQLIFVRDNN